MRAQGSSGLWLLVIGLIALFMVATMVAPALIDQTKGGASGGINNGGNGAQTLVFNTPNIDLGTSTMEQSKGTDITFRTVPETNTTGDGGSFAWLISIEGANGQGNGFQLYYGEQMVQWFAGQNGAIVGIGPRFTQGPGAVTVEVSATFSMVPHMAGSFTLKAWIAEAKDLVSLDPTGLKVCSPAQSQGFQVAQKVSTGVTVVQSLSGPGSAREDSYTDYALTSQAQATGKWKSSIISYIAIAKSGIRSSDILARVTTDRGSQYISLTDSGDRLVGILSTSSPFQGTGNSESAQWTTSFEIDFRTSAKYTIECWSVESGTEKALSSTVAHDVQVKKTIATTPTAAPSTPAVDNSTTNTTNSPLAAPSEETEDQTSPNTSNATPTPVVNDTAGDNATDDTPTTANGTAGNGANST